DGGTGTGSTTIRVVPQNAPPLTLHNSDLAGASELLVLALGGDTVDASQITNTSATVTLAAVGSHNTLIGGPGVNIIQGDSGFNTLKGMQGPLGVTANNLLFGTGTDTLIGGSGINTFKVLPAGASSGDPAINFSGGTLLGGTAPSSIVVTAGPAGSSNTLNFALEPAGVTVDLTQNTGAAQPLNAGGDQLLLSGKIQTLVGSTQADQLFAASGTSVYGGGGNDTLLAVNVSSAALFAGSGNASLAA